MNTYLVGGAVRDQLLGLPVQDRDWVVVGANPEQLLAQGFLPVGKDFPVFLHPESREEYALARTERKTGPGYKGFQCYTAPEVTLEEDLQRRDLTINAMAQDAQGNLIDPFHGLQDLKTGYLRHVSPAFAEDPVRILRVARFAARYAPRGFKIAPETLMLMKNMVQAGEVNALVAERVWAEMVKALAEAHPLAFFLVLQEVGALTILMPELQADFTVHGHPLQQVTTVSADPVLRFAALVLGLTPPNIKTLCRRLRVPQDYEQLAVLLIQFYPHYAQAMAYSPQQRLQQLEKADAFRRPQRFLQILQVCPALNPLAESMQLNWQQALQAAQQVDTKALAQAGFTGPAFGQALHERRWQAIALDDTIAHDNT